MSRGTMQNFLTVGTIGAETVELTGDEYHHATRACRVRVGEEIGVSDGCGRRVIARIEHIDHRIVRAPIINDVSGQGEPLFVLTLALAVIRPPLFELAVEKCTELGVREVVPIITERCVPGRDRHLKPDRLARIAREAAKQAARSFVPEIGDPVTLETFLCSLRVPTLAASLRADESIETALAGIFGARELACLIGPEGDFTNHECALMETAGIMPVSLGGLTLRSETAAIAASARILTGTV